MENDLGASKTASHTHVNVSSLPRYANDEAVLARFGKRQQLRVSHSLVNASKLGPSLVVLTSNHLDLEKLWPPTCHWFD